LEQAKYSEAIEAFTAAIRADPGNIEAYHGRAAAYAARGESKRSDDDRETAARLRLADQVKKDAPRFLARSPTFLALFTAVGGAALVLVWLCIRRLNILVGAKAPEWDTEDRPHKRDAP
jgi:tetratricopeptide (TPR) repeat protein